MEQDGAAVLTAEETQFRILQVTDLHSNNEERLNERTRDEIRDMVARFDPHFIAVLGDVWCGDEHPEAAPMWMARDLEFLGGLGRPWAMAWGNHDYCTSFDEALAHIRKTPNAVCPEGNGRGAFRIELRKEDGAVPRWDLFFLNSGPAWEIPRDTAWFEAEAARIREARACSVPAIGYFHIATGNYQRAIDEGRIAGVAGESELGWGDDEGRVAEILKAAGNFRACFCGHSHRNDFHFEEDSIVFAVSRATGYGGYGIEHLAKGGVLLELDMDSDEFQFKTVFSGGAVWHHDEADPSGAGSTPRT